VLRIGLLSLGVLLVYAASQYAMNHWTTWDASTKASVLAAGGTILLAVATFWSVWETRLVIRGEDRRQQQGLAPYLTATFEIDRGKDGRHDEIIGFQVKNAGYGIARNVSIHLHAYTSICNEGETFEERLEQAKKEKRPFTLEAVCDVIAEKSSEVMYIDRDRGVGPARDQTVVAKAVIRYVDTFGNEYSTIYENWDDGPSRWTTPKNLQLK
jgi:hypothetical protein